VFGASQGGYATHICCTEERLKRVPEGWSYEDAAGVFVTAPTSYAGLVVRAGIKKGTFPPPYTLFASGRHETDLFV
jgi:NADPH2:quinone reductase